MNLATETVNTAAFIAVALLLAFGIYQTVGTTLNTDVPVVAVTSGSMEPVLQRGDMVIVQGTPFDAIEEGDILVFTSTENNLSVPVIHRVVDKNTDTRMLVTKGDSNPQSYSFDRNITEDQILGTAVFPVPAIGYVKLIPTCLYMNTVYGPERVPDNLCPTGG